MKKKERLPASQSEREPETPALEDVLLALQKSFSRVSGRTAQAAQEEPDSPRALIVGSVNFGLSIKTGIRGDQLPISAQGVIDLTLSGIIEPDIVLEESEEPTAQEDDTPTETIK